MQANLLGDELNDDYLDFHYSGQSFDGKIDIEKLARELSGLDRVFKLSLAAMIRHKRVDISAREVSIFVEPFEVGSFRQRVRIVVKHLNKNAGAYSVVIGLSTIVLGIVGDVKSNSVSEIVAMSPALQMKIGDAVKIDLLQDKKFLKAISAATSGPLVEQDDYLTLSSPTRKVELGLVEKQKLDELAGNEEEQGDKVVREHLIGRITAVDMDATVKHLGFKVDNAGATVDCTIVDPIDSEKKKALLDQWVKIRTVSTYEDGRLIKILVLEIEIINPPLQQQMPLEDLGTGINK